MEDNNTLNTFDPLSDNLAMNIDLIKKKFHYPLNEDLELRDFYADFIKKNCVLLYIDSIADEKILTDTVMQPLITKQPTQANTSKGIDIVKNAISAPGILKINSTTVVVKHLLEGRAVLLADGYCEGISIAAEDFKHRDIDKPATENSIKGASEAFVESSKVNQSLIRKHIKSESLITETTSFEDNPLCKISLMYMYNLVEPELIAEIKKRVKGAKSDGFMTLAMLGQHIEEKPFSIMPTVLYTELPDRAASFIAEGYVVILMDNSPSCLVAPATFWSFFHISEDIYHRFIPGNFSRLIRFLSFVVSLYTPALYIAITNYHHEMIPTDLLLAIASSRERVPFPIVFEVIGMELAFEMIRRRVYGFLLI